MFRILSLDVFGGDNSDKNFNLALAIDLQAAAAAIHPHARSIRTHFTNTALSLPLSRYRFTSSHGYFPLLLLVTQRVHIRPVGSSKILLLANIPSIFDSNNFRRNIYLNQKY